MNSVTGLYKLPDKYPLFVMMLQKLFFNIHSSFFYSWLKHARLTGWFKEGVFTGSVGVFLDLTVQLTLQNVSKMHFCRFINASASAGLLIDRLCTPEKVKLVI